MAHYDVYYRLLLVLQISPRHNFLLKPLMEIYIEFTSPKSHKNNRIIVIMTYKKREALLKLVKGEQMLKILFAATQ